MTAILPAIPAPVNPGPVTSWPVVEFYPERDILDTEAESFAAWEADQDLDGDLWGDEFADEMAGLALAEARLDMGLMAW